MGRSRVYNSITSPEKIEAICKENQDLRDDFLSYLESIGRSNATIDHYRQDLDIFFCWSVDNLENKPFPQITKRDIIRFQTHAIKEWKWSPNRIRTVKAAMSSLGNYIENILDEEYKNYRSVVNKVESPVKVATLKKTTWNEAEVQKLLDKLTDMGDYERACFVALAAFSGRRKSELCRFRVSDFNDDKLVLDGALYKSDPIQTKGRGGGKYLNCYTLASRFKPYLDRWMAFRKEHGVESEWLFPSRQDQSKQIATSTVDSWSGLLSKLSGKDFYPHSMRHAFCTFLLKSGIPEGVVQSIIGWESADMLRVYDDRDTDEQLGRFFVNGEISAPKAAGFEEL